MGRRSGRQGAVTRAPAATRTRTPVATGDAATPPATSTPSPRALAVRLEWRLAAGLLTVTATTPARGATREDAWWATPPLALTAASAAEITGALTHRWVSRAVVAASSLRDDTTYTFGYAIVMRQGEITWAGSARITLTVGPGGVSVTALGGRAPSRAP